MCFDVCFERIYHLKIIEQNDRNSISVSSEKIIINILIERAIQDSSIYYTLFFFNLELSIQNFISSLHSRFLKLDKNGTVYAYVFLYEIRYTMFMLPYQICQLQFFSGITMLNFYVRTLLILGAYTLLTREILQLSEPI